jgi:hypothetical protein
MWDSVKGGTEPHESQTTHQHVITSGKTKSAENGGYFKGRGGSLTQDTMTRAGVWGYPRGVPACGAHTL